MALLGLASVKSNAFHQFNLQFVQRGFSETAGTLGNVSGLRSRFTHDGEAEDETCSLEAEVRPEDKFEDIIGRSDSLRAVLEQVKIVAPTHSTVLMLGETGTGKELMAHAIHGDMPLELQTKLLRVLQEQEFERLGSSQTTRVDVRVVAATSRDLPQMVADREFRSDLYYRLNVFPVRLPRLRERREDIALLVRHFVDVYAKRMNKRVERISQQAMQDFLNYAWPGNVRELQNFIERSVILSPGKVRQPPLGELKQPVERAMLGAKMANTRSGL